MTDQTEGSSIPHDQGNETTNPDVILQQMTSLIDSAMARNMANIERMVEDKLSRKNQEHNEANHHTEGETSAKASARVTFKAFKGCGATEFKGTEGPMAACSWIENIRKVFVISRIWTEDKVLYSSAMLTEEALHWWNARITSLGEEAVKLIMWHEFEDEFMRQFCPSDQRQKYEREFIELQQGSMPVTTYEAEFNKKSKFATELLSSEAVKVRRFIHGLRWEIKEAVQMQDPATLAEATRYARMREDILRIRDADSMPPPKRAQTDSRSSFFSSGRSPTFNRSSFRNRPLSVRT